MKFEIFKLEMATSRSDAAVDLIKSKKKSGLVYADTQTHGRGTHGKKWISDKGNLFASIFFPLKKNFPPFSEFSIINPVIISEVIIKYCKSNNITLKFPNDIFLNGKKICGILQEIITFNNINYLIIGIGMNVISNPKIFNKYEATNILKETQKKADIKNLIEKIISSYEIFFINLKYYNFISFKKKADYLASN